MRPTIILDVPFTGVHWTLSDVRQAANLKNESGTIFEAESRDTSVVMISFCMHPLGVSWQHNTELLGVDRRYIRFPNVSAYQEHHPGEYQKHI